MLRYTSVWGPFKMCLAAIAHEYIIAVERIYHTDAVYSHKLLYKWQLALDQILCTALLGWGKCCIMFWGRLDQNSGFHGNRKWQLTNNGENDVPIFSLLFFDQIFFKIADSEDRHKILYEFGFRPDRTTPYGVRCPWVSKKFPIDIMGKFVSKLTCSFFIGSLSKLLVKSCMSLNSGRIGSVTSELRTLEGRTDHCLWG